MGRKKKNKDKEINEDWADEEKVGFRLNISGEVKRSIAAIFLFAVAIISVLGFLEMAGILGEYIDTAIGRLFGVGKWLSPLVMVIAGVILLFRKETLFYVTKLIGLAVAFVSILGFLHLYVDEGEMLELAQDGGGGGYAGYVLAIGLLKLADTVAGTVILVAIFLIGAVVAFNFSLVSIFHKFPRFKSMKKEADSTEDETAELVELVNEESAEPHGGAETETENKEEAESAEKKTGEDDADSNIRNLKFSDDSEKEQLKDDNEDTVATGKAAGAPRKKNEVHFSARSLDHSWEFPPLDLLESATEKPKGGDVDRHAQIIEKTLSHFGIKVELGGIKTGPTVTQYSFRPDDGVKISRIIALNNDLALALAKHPIRIEAPIPGKSLIGIEVPNTQSAMVRMRTMLQSKSFQERKSNISLALGEDVSGNYEFGNLEKMPHLMIAGSTGAGKSVCIHSLLISLFYQNSPDDLKLIMVDPKRVELSLYNGIPYLLTDVIVENSKVVGALKWAIREMERRYRLLQDIGARDLGSYNQKIKEGEKRSFTDPETGEEKTEDLQKLPYIVIIIDELADLMQAHGKEVEGAIIRLAQMSRAVGIHLIVSTQRPSVEVLTGLIKANIATRIAFMVATQIDSRTILDASGAEKLLGGGDMLYLSANSPKPKRLQGVFVSEAEVKKVVKFIKSQKLKKGAEEIGEEIVSQTASTVGASSVENIDLDAVADNSREDSLYEEAKNLVVNTGKASASLLQRRFRIGYSRAANILDMLEENGVVGQANGAKPREILTGTPAAAPEYENPEADQIKRDKWQM